MVKARYRRIAGFADYGGIWIGRARNCPPGQPPLAAELFEIIEGDEGESLIS
jgi:hypothetical protein